MAFNQFPYSNVHELNLDWLLQEIKNQSSFIRDFAKNNTIKVHNPPEWNITTQYPAHNIVIDGYIAYLAIDNVPAGVDITNHDYWLEIMDITAIVNGVIADINAKMDKVLEELDKRVTQDYVRFNNKKILIVGDSVSDENFTIAGVSEVWVKHFREKLAPFNCQITNLSKSGRGYKREAASHTFGSVMATVDLNQFDYVVVFGGINDFAQGIPIGKYADSGTDSFWSGLRSVWEQLNAVTRQQEVYLISPLGYTGVDNSKPYYITDFYRSAIFSAARNGGFHFINGNHIPPFGVRGYHMNGKHPLDGYTSLLADYIYNAMVNGVTENFNAAGEVRQITNQSDENCTFNATVSMPTNGDLLIKLQGKATAAGNFKITIPDIGFYFGQSRGASTTGNTLTRYSVNANTVNVYGAAGAGDLFILEIHGLTNSLEQFVFMS